MFIRDFELHRNRMIRFCVLCLCLNYCLAAQIGEDESLPANITGRKGWKYLGYYLASLGAALGATNGNNFQTIPTTTTTAATVITNLPVFSTTQTQTLSPFPTAPPFTTDTIDDPNDPTITPPPGSVLGMSNSLSAFPQVNFGSNFPIAPPSFFSIGDIPNTVAVAQTATNSGGRNCGCTSRESCVSAGGVDVRIVTPPSGVQCPAGQVYCCIEQPANNCGLRNIIQGVNVQAGQARFGEYPWSAIVMTMNDQFIGGGVLITARHVLTVPHRFQGVSVGNGIKVRLGDWDIGSEAEPIRHVDVRVASINIHPNFDQSSLRNDIALLTLTQTVPLYSTQLPQINNICTPTAPNTAFSGRCVIAGWGKDQFNGQYQRIQKTVDIPIMGNAECQARLRQTRLGASYQLDPTSFICAGGEANRDSCTGDGGNALACPMNGKFYLAGLAAGGIGCASQGVPGLYVNVPSYLQWIGSVLASQQGNQGGGNQGLDPRLSNNRTTEPSRYTRNNQASNRSGNLVAIYGIDLESCRGRIPGTGNGGNGGNGGNAGGNAGGNDAETQDLDPRETNRTTEPSRYSRYGRNGRNGTRFNRSGK